MRRGLAFPVASRLAASILMARRAVAGALVATLFASCAGSATKPASPEPMMVGNGAEFVEPSPSASADPTTGGQTWAGRSLGDLPAESRLWDVAIGDSGVWVAVGTVETDDLSGVRAPLVVWRSADGRSWRRVYQYRHDLSYESGSERPRAAVAAHRQGFVIAGSTCADRCAPFALRSRDGTHWTEAEVPVRPPPGEDGGLPRSAIGAPATPVGFSRLVRGTPEFTVEGAGILDVAATRDRLVAVGWAEIGRYTTAGAAWLSDDGGKTWHQASEEAIPQANPWREELNTVVVAGGRFFAGGGNRCCHNQAVGEVWVSDTAGKRWGRAPFPERPVNIFDLAADGEAVHVLGWSDEFGEDQVHWRLSADGHWDRLTAPPTRGRLIAGPTGLVVVAVEEVGSQDQPPRLSLFRSPDGQQFRLSRASAPQAALELDVALVVGDRLLAYATAGTEDGRRHLLFEAPAGEG